MIVIIGQHYFVPNPNGAGLSPKWDFTSSAFNHYREAFVVAAKVNQSAAPTGPQDIAWVSLKSVTGKLAKQVYRTDTRLGQPPATVSLSPFPFLRREPKNSDFFFLEIIE